MNQIQKFSGFTRDVSVNGDYVFKTPRSINGYNANKQEYETWINAGEESRKFLCPVVSMIMDGSLLVMRRAKCFDSYEELDEVKSDLGYSEDDYDGFTSDLHRGNFGIYDGRLVLIDYGGHY